MCNVTDMKVQHHEDAAMSFGPNREIAEIDSIRYMINLDMQPTYAPMTGDPKARQRHMTNEAFP